MRKFFINTCNRRTDKIYTQEEIDLEELFSLFRQPSFVRISKEQFDKLDKESKLEYKDQGGFVAAEFINTELSRTKRNIKSRSMVTLDLDYATDRTKFEIFLALKDYSYCLYSTFSHTKEKPRYRLVIPLEEDISPDEYTLLCEKIMNEIGESYFDPTSSQAERLMFFPVSFVENLSNFEYEERFGKLLSIEDFDLSDAKLTHPTYSYKSGTLNNGEVEDPLKKSGLVGDWCRAISITEALDYLLSDEYEKTGENRYRLKDSKSAAGVLVYDDKFFYSHHAKDKRQGRLLNSFDLVRLSYFEDLEMSLAFKEMQKLYNQLVNK